MKVTLRNPDREVQVEVGRPISAVLDELADALLLIEIHDGAGR